MQTVLAIAARRATQRAALAGALAGLALILALPGCGDGGDRDGRAAPAGAGAHGNWDFERGDFTGWHTLAFESGAWHVYADGTSPPDPDDSNQHAVFAVPAPPQGDYAAVTDMRFQGARILHRTLRVDAPSRLRMTLFYESAGGSLASPRSLVYYTGRPNKQFRVELLDATAPVTSMAAGDRLATIFRTAPGDRASLPPREISFDLSRWAGQTVRLRFAQVDNRGLLRAGVDDIRVEATGDAE